MIEVKEDYSLKPYNTFAIDVKCRYFVESDEEEALRAFVADYEWQPSEVLILGGGSNFLFTEDFTGTVFYPAMQGKEVIKEDEEEVWVRIGAGVEWDDFVAWTVEQGWGGVENLSFIPGHVGAAPVQNVGAYGMEAGERIDRVVTGKYTALPLFLCAMLAMFVITFGPFGSRWKLQEKIAVSLIGIVFLNGSGKIGISLPGWYSGCPKNRSFGWIMVPCGANLKRWGEK